jgi:hypothetical protein
LRALPLPAGVTSLVWLVCGVVGGGVVKQKAAGAGGARARSTRRAQPRSTQHTTQTHNTQHTTPTPTPPPLRATAARWWCRSAFGATHVAAGGHRARVAPVARSRAAHNTQHTTSSPPPLQRAGGAVRRDPRRRRSRQARHPSCLRRTREHQTRWRVACNWPPPRFVVVLRTSRAVRSPCVAFRTYIRLTRARSRSQCSGPKHLCEIQSITR